MEPSVDAFVVRLREFVKSFQGTLEGLPPEALDWSPGPEMNSLAVLATHAAAATRYLIGDIIGGEPSGRVREAEFRAMGVDAAALGQRLGDAAMFAEGVVTKLDAADLAQMRFSPQHDRQYAVAWCMFRALDHLAEHLGHAQMTRLLWEQRVAAQK